MSHIGCQLGKGVGVRQNRQSRDVVQQSDTRTNCSLARFMCLYQAPTQYWKDKDAMRFQAFADVICDCPLSNAVCLCPRDSITQVQRERKGWRSVTFGHEITSHSPSSKLGDDCRPELRLNGRDRKRCHNEMGVEISRSMMVSVLVEH